MTDQEMLVRMTVVSRMMLCFGVTDEDRIKAIVEATSGIPWFIPEFRGNKDAGELLFPVAVQMAGQKTTYGAPSQGHITEAALSLAGKTVTVQGHVSDRQWVIHMRKNPSPLGMSHSEMMSINAPRTLQIDEG